MIKSESAIPASSDCFCADASALNESAFQNASFRESLIRLAQFQVIRRHNFMSDPYSWDSLAVRVNDVPVALLGDHVPLKLLNKSGRSLPPHLGRLCLPPHALDRFTKVRQGFCGILVWAGLTRADRSGKAR